MDAIKFFSRSKNDGSTKNLLKNNKVPCVIYGKDSKTESYSIDSKAIGVLIKDASFYSKILSVELNGKKEQVLAKDVQFHPVSENIIHVDFMRVKDTTKVTVEVPVDFLNRDKCPGLKLGGVLNAVRRKIELVCNANKIPDMLKFDLINSEIGDSIKISNIELPEGVKPTITDRDFVVATLVPPTVEAEPETKEAEDEGETKTEEEGDKKESKEETKGASKESKEESSGNKSETKQDKK